LYEMLGRKTSYVTMAFSLTFLILCVTVSPAFALTNAYAPELHVGATDCFVGGTSTIDVAFHSTVLIKGSTADVRIGVYDPDGALVADYIVTVTLNKNGHGGATAPLFTASAPGEYYVYAVVASGPDAGTWAETTFTVWII